MEQLIGRQKEKNRLRAFVSSARAEFLALYGRRRVGKTFLVNHVFNGEFAFKMTGVIDGSLRDQLTAFADAMEEFGYTLPSPPSDWMEAFIMLKKALKDKASAKERCVIFIDELPAMDAGNSNVAKALGYFWNSWASLQDNILLIVCGSATSWMITNVIDSKGGLHDRITMEIPIHPFSLGEVEEYLEEHGFLWDRTMILQAYMVFGGIPYYLSLLDKEESLVQNVDRLFFSRDRLMRREFTRLFSTLYKSPHKYVEMVMALAKSRKGMTREQLAKLLKCDNNGHLGKRLEDLVCCDLVRKNIVREKKIKKKDAIYQLCDFFSLFYLTFIDRAETEEHYWLRHINTPEVNSWMGLAYERICMAHLVQIKKALRIDAISTLSYSWRGKHEEDKAQIDIVIERADHIVNICEVKFCQQEFVLDKEEYENINHRKSTFIEETKLKHTPWITIISTYGLARSKYTGMVQSQVKLDDLFESED